MDRKKIFAMETASDEMKKWQTEQRPTPVFENYSILSDDK